MNALICFAVFVRPPELQMLEALPQAEQLFGALLGRAFRGSCRPNRSGGYPPHPPRGKTP
jgi:hypothetical protein